MWSLSQQLIRKVPCIESHVAKAFCGRSIEITTAYFSSAASTSTSSSTTQKSVQVLPSSGIASDPSSIKASFRDHLETQRERALAGGGLKRIQKQHERGSLSARERIHLLFDKGSFCEVDQLKVHRTAEFGMDSEENKIPGDGVVTGYGTVNGRTVFAFSQDFTGEYIEPAMNKFITSF